MKGLKLMILQPCMWSEENKSKNKKKKKKRNYLFFFLVSFLLFYEVMEYVCFYSLQEDTGLGGGWESGWRRGSRRRRSLLRRKRMQIYSIIYITAMIYRGDSYFKSLPSSFLMESFDLFFI